VFVGNSQRKLDDKGRIVLSAALRDEFNGLGYIAVTDECLTIWTDEGYRDFTDRVQRRVREDGDLDSVVLRKLASDSDRIRADSQGRITLPSKYLEKVGIGAGAGTEVVVNGVLDRIEIWAPDVWDALSEEGNDALKDAMRKGGL
jgi:division/cell wall cluster transcriptional repressor MraZ